jgi:hypothetical protein
MLSTCRGAISIEAFSFIALMDCLTIRLGHNPDLAEQTRLNLIWVAGDVELPEW